MTHTPEQQAIVERLAQRWSELRRLGHHDGAIYAGMNSEGYAAGAIIAAKDVADSEGRGE